MKIIYLVIILFTGLSFAEGFKCDNTATTDSSNCLQSLINYDKGQNRPIILNSGKYLVSKSLIIPANTQIRGNNTTLILESDAGIVLDNVANITISNLNFEGGGHFLTTKTSNALKSLNAPYIIGFSNPIIGLLLKGNVYNVNINNNQFHGLNFAIRALSNQTGFVNNLVVDNNKIQNIGATAIYIFNGSGISITNNSIHDVWGNIVAGIEPKLSDSKFADAIYLNGVINARVINNNIQNVARIGVVLEGSVDKAGKLTRINDNILIENNVIKNVNGSRGTECNAGIWVEPSLSRENPQLFKTRLVTIKNNMIDNVNAKAGAHIQYGLFLGALHSIVKNNQISNFTNLNQVNDVKSSGGIRCVYGYTELLNNMIYNNNIGIFFNGAENLASYKLDGNTISNSKYFMYYPELNNVAGVKLVR